MKNFKKITLALLAIYTMSNISLSALCAPKNKDQDEYAFNLITSPIETAKLEKCLYLGYDKGYRPIIYNITTKFLIKEVLTPIEQNVKNLDLFFTRMPVGVATIDLPIIFSSNESKNKKIEKFLKEEILNSKIQNKTKGILKDKTKVKKSLEKIIEDFQKGLEKSIKFYEKKLKNLQNEKNENNFYYSYGKKYLNSMIYPISFQFDDTEKFSKLSDGVFNDDLTNEEETSDMLKRYLNDRQFLIKVGKKMYEKNIFKYQDILKYLNQNMKELKSNIISEQKKEKFINDIIKCLGFIETKNELVVYKDRLWEATIKHILEANEIEKNEIKNKK